MIKIFLLIIFSLNFILSIVFPWIGICWGYLFNILGPQFIWWWAFEGIRPFLLIAIPTIIGFFLSVLKGTIDFNIIKNRYVLAAILYFVFVILSYWYGPYVHVVNKWRFFDSGRVLDITWKVFLFFFIALCCISDERKIKFFSLVLPIAIIYLIYWANMQYLTGKYFIRLKGPHNSLGEGIYNDENVFAMAFVVGQPFLFYLGWYYRKWYVRWLFWIAIPFGWHAIFLTGSRGGMVGILVVIIVISLQVNKKIIGLFLISLFIFAYVWQGGTTMKNRTKTIFSFKKDSSAEGRIQAWKAGVNMIKAHPFTGVGIASFGQAFPDYSDKEPRVAHNTFIQIAAESGLPAALSYIFFILGYIKILLRSRDVFEIDSLCFFVNNAVLASIVGFLVCASFLTLNTFEIQFYLIVLANSIKYLYDKKLKN